MKYFQLFEQFLNEDSLKINESLEDDKKMLSDLDNKIEEERLKNEREKFNEVNNLMQKYDQAEEKAKWVSSP